LLQLDSQSGESIVNVSFQVILSLSDSIQIMLQIGQNISHTLEGVCV